MTEQSIPEMVADERRRLEAEMTAARDEFRANEHLPLSDPECSEWYEKFMEPYPGNGGGNWRGAPPPAPPKPPAVLAFEECKRAALDRCRAAKAALDNYDRQQRGG